MSKIKHWNGQLWVIDGASNAANIELTNPGFLDENGDSISVDLGFTKIDNRMNKLERNLAWIYQNGAKGGGGGGGGGGIDSTEYTITVEEGSRVYAAGTSVTIHITINGGSLRKIFQVEISNAQTGERLASPVVTGLTRTEITINGLSESTLVLKISAHTGLYYASDFILTVVAGAIKLLRTRIPPAEIYATSVVADPIFLVSNSTDSNLKIVVTYTTDLINYNTLIELDLEKTNSVILDISIPAISKFLMELAKINIGETFTFNIYAQGVLNDTLLKSNVISFSTSIIKPNTLYILTYGVNKSVPTQISDLSILNLFVYGQSIQFDYLLSFSKNDYPQYEVQYSMAPCYFEDGVLVTDIYTVEGAISHVDKDKVTTFTLSTASLPTDTIYDTENNLYKFIKLTLTATSDKDNTITDTKVLYFTLSKAVEKYITATNFDRSLICYYSPVMGVPTGNISTWRYDNQNTQFPYNRLGIVQLRYIDLIGYNINSLRNGFSTQGVHLTGKSYALLGLNLFSVQNNEVNLLSGNGFTISTTFKTDANIDNDAVVLSVGKYQDNVMSAGIEITASRVKVVVNKLNTSLNITKGDLVTIDIVLERYVGEGDASDSPTHWFVKIFLNGVLSSLGSYLHNQFTNSLLNTGWFFEDYLCLGARVRNDEVISAADVHFYDFKVYSTALSDNEIVQNQVSAVIYSELENGETPSLTLQTELLSKNFIQINTEGNYESLLFDTNNIREYKDDTTLLSTLRAALADSKIPYPIVVINLLTANSNFYGTTQAQFSEDLKAIVTGQEYRYPINMDYYTMGNTVAIRISNQERMLISIQGTSSLQFVSKNYEIYMGSDDSNKPVLVLMREDWLPENEYTLKADVMDSAHVNNVLIGRIINGMVTTTDASGQEVAVRPLDNTPPMNTINQWASKIKHTSEGYPVILFINFRNSDGSTVTKCQGIYNFNLGRAASFNLGLKLLNSCTFVDNSATFPRIVETYEESSTVVNNSPVYSIEVGENNQQIGAFDQDDANILSSGIFDIIYASDGAASTHLLRLLTFLANFGWNIESPKKELVDGLWCTPKVVKNGNAWLENGTYYYPANSADYVLSTLEFHMNWNNLIAYYMIAIIFGLVDSMGKNLTLRTWNMKNDENGIPQCVWYMCFYDMDTAMRLDNDGNETVPYNAHLNRYYTYNGGVFSEAKVDYHTASIAGQFTLVYSSYNTRLQEIAENLREIAKSLNDIYSQLRNTLFPDPGAFIDKYYTGQINQIGAALYNYDYKLKYLQTKKQYSVQTGEITGTHDYNQISYLHGNGATNIKSWFRKRIRFLDGIYGATTDGISTLNNNNLIDVTLNEIWSNNQAIKNINDPTVIQLTLASESQTFINISMGTETKSLLWINETPTVYKIRNVSAQQRISVYGNKVLTVLDGFNKFRWIDLNAIDFPLVKALSLKGATNINAEAFIGSSQTITGLQSLRQLDLSNVLLVQDSSIVYKGLSFTQNLPSLEWLDISNSSFNAVQLPLSGVLKYLNISNTKIEQINFDGLPLLEEVNLNDCNNLRIISFKNCPKIKNLSIPASVELIELVNCPGLESLICTFSGRLISPLYDITTSGCLGLKVLNVQGQNNPLLKIDLLGAPNLETVNLSHVVSENIKFSDSWTSLKSLDISNTSISALNYKDTIATFLDLKRHTELYSIMASNNYSLEEVQCPNIEGHKIGLSGGAFKGCTALRRIIGNFEISGTQVFSGCTSLKLNSDYTGIVFTDDYIPGDFCNISFSEYLSSYSEMFAQSGVSGQDFRYIMSKLHENVATLNKMFQGCSALSVVIWRDLFNKCPNVTDITSFVEGTQLSGIFYSTSEYGLGILDYLPHLSIANYAFANTSLEWIDNNVFKNNSNITEADYMFSNCLFLHSCTSTDSPSDGYLHSKDFFLNLSALQSVVPKGMFLGCKDINMIIDSEEVGGVMFDYLFHCPINKTILNTNLNDSLYTGVNLIGEIHANVFGGILNSDMFYYIPTYSVIVGPFANSNNMLLTADLSSFGDMFKNLNPTSLTNVLKGIHFSPGETNRIPNNIFKNCTSLINVSGFFSNDTITNGGEDYEFPSPELFRDCTNLLNVSNLFSGDKYLNIKLVGEGFIHNPISNFSGMLQNSGVFGIIPYKFLRTSGKTIKNLENIFKGCYKLGYTKDRTISEGMPYFKADRSYLTTWDDAVIGNPGTPIRFNLDYSDINVADSLYIDGLPWPTEWRALSCFDQEVWDADDKLYLVLHGPLNRQEGYYLNYMFPADLFYSCSDECNFTNALRGLSYQTNILEADDNGVFYMEKGPKDGLKGRLPMKLFKNNTGLTEIGNVFADLDFCPFIGFDSYVYDSLKKPVTLARGIKLPPDLFRYTSNITSLTETFKGMTVEAGIDLNLNLSYMPGLRSIKGLLSDVQFYDSPVSGDMIRTDDTESYLNGNPVTYPQLSADAFLGNHELRDVSSLFQVTSILYATRGLIHVSASMFQPEEPLVHPYLSDVSSMFFNNSLLTGTIPLMLGSYITSWSGYIEGVQRYNIKNANAFISVHPDISWLPISWRDN